MKKTQYFFRVVEHNLGEGNQAYEVAVTAPNELQGYYLVAQEFPNHKTIDRIKKITKFPSSLPAA